MDKKKALATLLAGCLSIGCFAGCFGGGSSESSLDSSSEEVFTGVLYEQDSTSVSQIKSGETLEIEIGKDVQDNNFLTIDLQTNCNLIGYINYVSNQDATVNHQEKIYIEADSETFSMFLDAFRIGAFGAFEKKITKITLRNVDKTTGLIKVNKVHIGDRTYDNQEMLYTQNKYLKIGASLAAGGSLCHVESLDRNVVEYMDQNGFVHIEENVDQDALRQEFANVITDEVNMVNVHDLGREIQQSFYANIDETNGYAPDDEVLYEGNLLYNPVQAGSAGDNQSQIIDYRVDEKGIYVKCRPQDWFLDNTQTDSYMESTYLFEEDGTLRVINRFVNFAEYAGMETARIGGQETPAIYIVHPLNYFYCETKSGTIFDPELLGAMDTPSKHTAYEEMAGDYHYNLANGEVPNEWFAFVNDKKFGLGIYMPNFDQLVASRGWTSTYYWMEPNHYYNDKIYNLYLRNIPSMYVSNYNYCCPSVIRQMVDFVPFEYTFALYVGTVDEMRDTFGQIKKDNEITNKSMEVWKTWDSLA